MDDMSKPGMLSNVTSSDHQHIERMYLCSSLKLKGCNSDNFIIIGCTRGCQSDSLRDWLGLSHEIKEENAWILCLANDVSVFCETQVNLSPRSAAYVRQ